jgi:hypothetical protein
MLAGSLIEIYSSECMHPAEFDTRQVYLMDMAILQPHVK